MSTEVGAICAGRRVNRLCGHAAPFTAFQGYRRIIRSEITERVLDAGEQVLEHLGVREHLGTVSKTDVDNTTVAVTPNPAHWKIHIHVESRHR